MEKSDLETERLKLVEDVLENKATMKELEDNLLEKLTSIEGSLVEDEGLIHVLRDTKATAEEVRNNINFKRIVTITNLQYLGQQKANSCFRNRS